MQFFIEIVQLKSNYLIHHWIVKYIAGPLTFKTELRKKNREYI